MANIVDSDQTAPKEQSDLGLHYLLMHFVPVLRGITAVARFYVQCLEVSW